MESTRDLARQYNEALPSRIRSYLNDRGIVDYLIDHHLLGWNGERITIPIFGRDGMLAFFKLAKDPEDISNCPKMIAPAGSSAELYGWERVQAKPLRIIICEGEFDRLVLESNGFGAVISTGGAGLFRPEWAEAFSEIPEVYLCFDRDEPGRAGARRVARLIPHARLVELPEEVGESGDVTDYFVRLGHGREEFAALLESAKPLPQAPVPETLPTESASSNAKLPREIDRVKAAVAIEDVIGKYVKLSRSGRTFVGRCPFHADQRPSFVVYPETQSFYCFGCRAHGDVIDFLMRQGAMTFPDALSDLRNLAAPR